MNSRDVELIKLRYIEKKSFKEIGGVLGVTGQRIKQIFDGIEDEMLSAKVVKRWQEYKGLPNLDGDLLKLICLMDREFRDRVRRFIHNKKIRELSDFRHHSLTTERGIGETIACRIKLALLRLGEPYDDADMEEIERLLLKLEKEDLGLCLRFKIFERDSFTCQYCGRSPRKDPSVILNLDHIRPLTRNGLHEEKNLITSCRECNIGKKDMVVDLD